MKEGYSILSGRNITLLVCSKWKTAQSIDRIAARDINYCTEQPKRGTEQISNERESTIETGNRQQNWFPWSEEVFVQSRKQIDHHTKLMQRKNTTARKRNRQHNTLYRNASQTSFDRRESSFAHHGHITRQRNCIHDLTSGRLKESRKLM